MNPNDGLTSLREAIEEANSQQNQVGQQRITFAAGVNENWINLDPAKGELVLAKNIFIDGPADGIIIARDPDSPIKHRIFRVNGTSTSTLARLSLYDGEVNAAGGAVRSEGNLTLEQCRIFECKASNSIGGGVAALAGTLTLNGCKIERNVAANGGGVYIGARVTTTINGGEILFNYARVGGGIYIDSSTTANPTSVTLNSAQVHRNEADERGGGIMVSAPSAGAGTTLSLYLTAIYFNKSLSDNPSIGQGGGIYFGRGTLVFGGVTIEDNTAKKGKEVYRRTGTSLVLVPFTNNQYEEEVGP